MNNGRWTPAEHEYIMSHYNKLTIRELADYLKRSELAIKLYLHRHRLNSKITAKRNLIQEILKLKFREPEDFSPSRRFYNSVGINQMRWWDLYHGRKTPTSIEYLSLAKYFDVTLEDAMNSRQLTLFDETYD